MLAKFAAMEDALKTSMADVQASVTLVHTKLSTLTDQVRHSQFVFRKRFFSNYANNFGSNYASNHCRQVWKIKKNWRKNEKKMMENWKKKWWKIEKKLMKNWKKSSIYY